MNFYSLQVGDKEYKLRIASRNHAELDKLMGGKFLKIMQDEEAVMSAMEICRSVLLVAMKPFERENGAKTPGDIDDIIDELVDEGWSTEKFIELVVEIGEVSGFFPRGAGNKVRETQALSESAANEM